MARSSNFTRNLSALYSHYGSPWKIFVSFYFWTSVGITILCWRRLDPLQAGSFKKEWTEIVLTVSPALAGFSVASFALIFSVLDEKKREILSSSISKSGGSSPLLIIASSLFHALFVQIISIIYAIIYSSKPFPSFSLTHEHIRALNAFYSGLGFLIFAYGLFLVVAIMLTIFRVLDASK